MQITHVETALQKDVLVEPVIADDYKIITKSKYYFNWKVEKTNAVFKLKFYDSEEILGLMSLKHFEEEERFEIVLLAVSKENRGKAKKYEGIAEILITYACREAAKLYAETGCVSLIPKTRLRSHYIRKYGMLDGGFHLFLEGRSLYELLRKHEI